VFDRIIEVFMSVIMRFGSRKAILCGARWLAADRDLEALLNDATRKWLQETGGPALGDADPDYTTARVIGTAHGGRIHRTLSSERISSRDAYLSARQLGLF
jgi:hypothetical protein